MSYYDQPRYWFVTRRQINEQPNLKDLIWPNGFESEREYLGEFYHIPHTHPNSALLGIILANNEVKHIGHRPEAYFPAWRQ